MDFATVAGVEGLLEGVPEVEVAAIEQEEATKVVAGKLEVEEIVVPVVAVEERMRVSVRWKKTRSLPLTFD